MRSTAIEVFLRAIPVSDIRVKPRFVTSACPFAYWTHGGRDTSPSFGVKINPEGMSTWNCKGGNCGLRGANLNALVWELERRSGTRYPELHKLVQRLETPNVQELQKRIASVPGTWTGRSLADYAPKPKPPPASPELTPQAFRGALSLFFDPLPEFVFEAPVFTKRSIPRADYERFGLLWHASTHRIALPVRDREGNVQGITGRVLDDSQCPCGGVYEPVRFRGANGTFKTRPGCSKCRRMKGPKYLHSEGFHKDDNLFGLHLVPPGRPIGGLVEGHFDAIACSQVIPSVAAMGNSISAEQTRLLAEAFSGVVIVRDGDEAGAKIAAAYTQALMGRLPVVTVSPPEGLDPDELPPEDRRALILGGVQQLLTPPPLTAR